MGSSPSWNTAAYWGERAIEMRKLADDVKDAGTRAVMLRTAGALQCDLRCDR
jgi:hypothetical protein